MVKPLPPESDRGGVLVRRVPPSRAYHEIVDASGQLRPHQAPLFERLGGVGEGELAGVPVANPEDIARLQQRIDDRLTEQEVTYNILGVPRGRGRRWNVDPLPWVIAPGEFERLAAGLRQRARVVAAALADLYGEQLLCRRGVVPWQVVLGNPHYWRACHGWQPVGGDRLPFYAVDLGRAPDGSFLVYSDRAAAPTGSGYALENRLAVGRVLPRLFRRYPVRKLNVFFHAARAMLENMAPHADAEPRVCVLSAGPQDESSFEHAYLARYFGFELVEGRDLTVRERHVFLKTLGGLRRVDVIWRRIFDDWCDPLELREAALGGVAGLTAAARSGHVALANPLGSGLLESPVFLSFLPRIARELLGEELELSAVPTYWCGDPDSFAEVLSHLDEFLLKPAFDERRAPPMEPRSLSAAKRSALIDRLKARPHAYVAQRWPERSRAPFWDGRRLTEGHLALRTFLCRSGREQDDYVTMPGGLCRVADSPDGLFLFADSEQASKDVWVVDDGDSPEPDLPSMPKPELRIRRSGDEMPSRLLDDLFWLGRSLERADILARMIRFGLVRSGAEGGALDAATCLQALQRLQILDDQHSADVVETAQHPVRMSWMGSVDELLAVLASPAIEQSLASTIRGIRSLTGRVRSRLSSDSWHALQQLSQFGADLDAGRAPGADVETWLNQFLLAVAAVYGALADNMVRGSGWAFLVTGRRLERGTVLVATVEAFLNRGRSSAELEAMLELTDSLLTYRERYLSQVQAPLVIDLLITDDTNPHSLRYQVERIVAELRSVQSASTPSARLEEQGLTNLAVRLATADPFQLSAEKSRSLRELLVDALETLWHFSDRLTERYFSLTEAAMPVHAPEWVDEDLEVGR